MLRKYLFLVVLMLANIEFAVARDIRVGVYDNPPKISYASDQQPSGLFIDLLQLVAAQEGWRLRYVHCQWAACLEALKAGEIDLMPDVAFSEARDASFDFHQTPALLSWSQVYRHQRSAISSLLDLHGKRVSVLQGSLQERFLIDMLENFGVRATTLPVSSLDEAFRKVEVGEADAAVANHFYGDFNAQRYRLEQTSIIFQPAKLFFAVGQGKNADLLIAIERQLVKWNADPSSVYFQLLTDWSRPGSRKHIPAWVWWGLAGVAVLFVAILGANLWLRREVGRKVRSLQEEEARFRLVFDSVSEGIFIQSPTDAVVREVNQSVCEMFGVTQAAARNMSIGQLSSGIEGFDQKAAAERVQKAVTEGPQVFEWQAKRLDNDHLFWVEVSLRAIRLGDEDCVLAVVRDISERKAAIRALEASHENLEGLVARRTEELEKSRAEAQRLAQIKSEFLANMSHEIRTPLNGVLGLARVAYRRFAGSEAQGSFGRIIESGQILQGVIDDILDFSKIEAGKLSIEAKPIELPDQLDGLRLLLGERAEAKGNRLTIDQHPSLPRHCLGDSLRLNQVLLNLLSNAIKFTEAGQVRLSAQLDDGQLVFEVSDTGVGMSPDQVAGLFRAFEQGDSSITRKFGGTGLGLVIAKRLVELMGGSIEVDSQLGAGSRFTVRLPYVAAEVPALRAMMPGPTPPGRRLEGIRVLVAEDNEINQAVIEYNLIDEGATVVVVGNGQEAVDRIKQDGVRAYDVVLMDVMMPVMDGYEATREIRKLTSDLPVIGQTAHAMAEEAEHCMACGMVDRITKPIDPELLVTTLLRFIKRAP